MNRAKSFCSKLAENESYKNLEKKSSGDGFQYLTGLIEEEILGARKNIEKTHKISAKKVNEEEVPCSLERDPQEQAINLNLNQYLDSLERHCKKLLFEWYKGMDNVDGFFRSYKK